MYFLISNLLRPYTLLVGLGLAAYLLTLRRRASEKRVSSVLPVVAVGLWLISTPAVSYLAIGSLEWRYSPSRERPEDISAIVILGGYFRPRDRLRTRRELEPGTMGRCVLGAELYHRKSPCLVIVSGGTVNPYDATPVANVMAEFLVRLDIDRDDILVEDVSTTTYENACNVAELLKSRNIRRVVLVTSAAHLLRSEMCFRRQGIDVVPRGSNFRATQFRVTLMSCLPVAWAASSIDEVTHEWLGILWYWSKGRV